MTRGTNEARKSLTGRWAHADGASCAKCGRSFATVAGFDAHRSRGRCINPVTVGMKLAEGVWRVT